MFLLFWDPIFACYLIQNSKCIGCKCDKDKHQRNKKYYIDKRKEKPLPLEEQEQIEKEIQELESSLYDINQIQDAKKSVLDKKKK